MRMIAAISLFTIFLSQAPAAELNFDKLELHKVRGEATTYRGEKAVRLIPVPVTGNDNGLAIVPGPEFLDGTIEVDVAGNLAPGHSETARGFIGIAFRIAPDVSRYDLLYVRPTNGRAEDQVRRNHSAAYEAFPDWPFDRLRKENPEAYESYVDLELGAWTKLKIVVEGSRARMYVNGANQPCLVINLKSAPQKGAIALWAGPGTDGYFANLRVAPARVALE
jgi:hypothetical protein